MAFSVNALTSDGNALLAQATSSNPIVYIGAVASEYDFSAAEIADMGSIQDQGWTITDGVVVAASATDITARIIMGFYNRPQAVVCKTFGVVGRLQSQSDAQAVVVAAVSDSSASIRLPGSDEASVRVEVAIDMAISDQLSVSVTSSTAGSAMLSDLDRLVSCHKAGQPYSGDDQTIWGRKLFKHITHFGDIHTDYGRVDVSIGTNNANHYGFIQAASQADSESLTISQRITFCTYENTNYSNSILVNTSIIPDFVNNYGDVNLGAEGARFESIYGSTTSSIEYYLEGGALYIRQGQSISAIGELSTQGGGSTIYLKSYSGTPLVVQAIDAELRLDGYTITLESTDCYITSDLTVSGAASLGGLLFNTDITNTNCHLIPRPQMKAGGIFLAYLNATTNTIALYAGDFVPSGLGVFIAQSETTQYSSPAYIPRFSRGTSLVNDGLSFKFMCDVQALSSGQYVIALLMCVKNL